MCMVVLQENPQEGVPKTVKKMELNFTLQWHKPSPFVLEYSHKITEVMLVVMVLCFVVVCVLVLLLFLIKNSYTCLLPCLIWTIFILTFELVSVRMHIPLLPSKNEDR